MSERSSTLAEVAGELRIDERDLIEYVRHLPGEDPRNGRYQVGNRLGDQVEQLVQAVPVTTSGMRDRAEVCEALGIRAPLPDTPTPRRPSPHDVPRPGVPRSPRP